MGINIVQKTEEVLRQIAKEVPKKDFGGAKLKKMISDMKKALASQDDGVAIAAPQIGVSVRIFVVSGRVIAYSKGEDVTDENDSLIRKKYPDLVFINPVITKSSRDKKSMEEGCLSIRYLYGKVKRSNKVTLTAYDENGEKITRGASGLMAQIFQHETDHLDGILFTDKATDVKDMPPEAVKKINK